MGQQRPPGGKKSTFFKNGPAPDGMPKQVFLARFELVVALMGCFGTKNGSKMGQKCVFPKMIWDHLGHLNK